MAAISDGIDPSSPRCDAFYEAMARLNISLLSHAGGEVALPSHVTQDVNNPLRLRWALDHGVRVIVAHCASLGSDHTKRLASSTIERV